MSKEAPVAGYSGTPLSRKLGIKEDHDVAFVGAPEGFDATLGGLPPGVRVKQRAFPPLDVVVLFVTRGSALRRRFPRLRDAIDKGGGLWVAWPKRSSGVATDLDGNAVREVGLELGLVDNKVCAIDETWSGLRFVWRVEDR